MDRKLGVGQVEGEKWRGRTGRERGWGGRERGSHLVGESEGSPVNGHRAFGLKVLVDLNGLFRVDVLPLHHVPGSKSLQSIKSD